jgi:hypothetical protein
MTQYNFSVFLLISLFVIWKSLNEEESKVILIQEFEIILTQSLSIQGSLVLKHFTTFETRLLLNCP